MNLLRKINWLFTYILLTKLKWNLYSRIKGENQSWLQNSWKQSPHIFNRIDFIIEQCKNQNVLHIGFTDHPFTNKKIKNASLLHLYIKKVSKNLMGIDIEKDAIQQYIIATNDTAVFYGDITTAYPIETIHFKPDLILLTEVIEHLKNPYQAVDVLYDTFPHATRVLVTVPNHISLSSLAAGLHHTESIHPDHYWYFSPYTLCRLFDKERFTMEQLHFGMYFQPGKRINCVLQKYIFNADCIIAVFSIKK